MFRPVSKRTFEDVAAEWDRVASLRVEQIEQRKDISFSHVLLPTMLHLCANSDMTSVIDVGCGVGLLTEAIARSATRVVGVDLSPHSIQIARTRLRMLHDMSAKDVKFVHASVEDYASQVPESSFMLAVANMTLNTVLSLESLIGAVARLLEPGGHFVFTVTRPCFWPLYWGYATEPWFNYKKETFIEAPFRISLEKDNAPVATHVHRPIEQYLNALSATGLVTEKASEPMPGLRGDYLYPEPWKYAHFLALKCVRL